MNETKNNNDAARDAGQNITEILTPVAEHCGAIIHESETGTLHYFDRDGYMHTRNNRLGKAERMEWIKKDIEHYAKNGWLTRPAGEYQESVRFTRPMTYEESIA